MKILVIVSFIENINAEFTRELAKESDYIICADAGQFIAKKYGITPDVCIGDFDSTNAVNIDNKYSCDAQEYKVFDCDYITYPAEKNLTDAEASLEHVAMRYPDSSLDIIMLGGIGGRLDHTIGALNTIREYSSKDVRIRLLDMKNCAEFISSKFRNSLTIKGSPYYKFFSVIPYDEYADGVSITGAKYNLDNIRMKRLGTLGISNEIANSSENASNSATVKVLNGELLIIRSSDF